MHIVVILAGIADPKRPLECPPSGQWLDTLAVPATSLKLSPFDEAALETALKLRDRNPAAKLTAVVTHGAHDLALMRTVASHRLDRVAGLHPPPQKRGEPDWLAEHALDAVCAPDSPADLILIGREHGDLDDGMTPAFLAAKWKLPFIGLAQNVQAADAGAWLVERAGTIADETYTLTGPSVVSITNAKGNRLRHPLMKNVMQAKQQKFDVLAPRGDSESGRAETTGASPPATVARGTVPCEMLRGDVAKQARQLANYLLPTSAENDTHAR